MKVLLTISPNFSIKMLEEEVSNIKRGNCDFTKSVDWRPAMPLGILYLAGALRMAGHNVQICDLHRTFYECREKGYFKKNDLSNFFEDHFDSILKGNEIDVLGISGLFNVSSSSVEEMAIRCRRISPYTKIILGGNYPTIMYREILNADVCDYIVLGEAEKELIWLLDNIRDPFIDKKVYVNPHIVDHKSKDKPDKKTAIIEDLDSLSMPAWDLLPQIEDYIENSISA